MKRSVANETQVCFLKEFCNLRWCGKHLVHGGHSVTCTFSQYYSWEVKYPDGPDHLLFLSCLDFFTYPWFFKKTLPLPSILPLSPLFWSVTYFLGPLSSTVQENVLWWWKMFYDYAIQHGSHSLHVAIKHLKCE